MLHRVFKVYGKTLGGIAMAHGRSTLDMHNRGKTENG